MASADGWLFAHAAAAAAAAPCRYFGPGIRRIRLGKGCCCCRYLLEERIMRGHAREYYSSNPYSAVNCLY